MHTVMLVDDEMFVRKGLRNLIDWESLGYAVVDEADNGEDALALIKSKKPDLVITDIRMPVLDGLELIGQTLKLNPDTSFIIISGYNDFSYAQQAVRYGIHDFVLKPIDEEELTETLKRLSSKIARNKLLGGQSGDLLKERIVDSLIRGDFDKELSEGWAKELSVEHSNEIYYAFIEVNDVYTGGTPPSPEGSMKERIALALRNSCAAASGVEVFVKEHHGRVGFLITGEQIRAAADGLEIFARTLQRELSESLNATVFLYFGKPIRQFAELAESYLTAKEALQYKFVLDEDKFVTYDKMQAHSVHYQPIDDTIYRQLIEQIEEQNFERIMIGIDALFQSFRDKRYVSEAVKSAIGSFVNGIIALIHSMEGDERELATLERMVGWHDQNVSPAELKRLFTEFALESAEVIAKLRKECVKGGIQKIKAYIETHYHENISLKSIAAIFYMNPVYLGQLFKKSYGVYFNEYVLQLRIAEAKKLLRQTDLRIYEIAEKVGFSNADYFVTQFEKLEKLTPSEYRNKLLDKK
jgi:two-component system, response regulator YesN